MNSTRRPRILLLFTEVFNFGIHGVESPSGVTFALGSTVVNTVMIFLPAIGPSNGSTWKTR